MIVTPRGPGEPRRDLSLGGAQGSNMDSIIVIIRGDVSREPDLDAELQDIGGGGAYGRIIFPSNGAFDPLRREKIVHGNNLRNIGHCRPGANAAGAGDPVLRLIVLRQRPVHNGFDLINRSRHEFFQPLPGPLQSGAAVSLYADISLGVREITQRRDRDNQNDHDAEQDLDEGDSPRVSPRGTEWEEDLPHSAHPLGCCLKTQPMCLR